MYDDGRALLDRLGTAQRVLLTGPVAPDGDSIGACLALARVLRARGSDVTVGGTPPHRYTFLAATREMRPDDRLGEGYDAVVVLDGDRHRLEPHADRCFREAAVKGIVDHHVSSTTDGYTDAWIDARAESTCGMLLRAFLAWGVPLDRELAELLYTGIVFDTGAFRHPNTSAELLRLSADLLATGIDHANVAVKVLAERSRSGVRVMGEVLAGATYAAYGDKQVCVGRVPRASMDALREGDLEGVIDALLNSEGTDLAVLLIERESGVKYSLRSRGVDVAALARQLHPTGGGHPRAAGASFKGPLPAAEQHLVETLTRTYAT